MNEQALQDSFNLFASQGYKGDIDSYKKLISSNEEAFNDAFSLFSSNGYKGDSNQFKSLVGIENQVKTNDSASADPAVGSTEDMGSKSEEPLSAWQSIKNTFKKAGERLYDVVEFWGTDEGANSGLDIATNSFYSLLSSQEAVDEYAKNNPGWLSEGMGSEKTIDAIKKYKEEQEESNFATKGLVASAKEGDVGGLIAGAVEGLVNAFSSGVYFLGTAGAGVFSEVAAENYIAYNEQKAKNLGISLDELIKSGEADNLAPVGLGAVSVGLERFGFGKVLKAAAGKNIIKNISNKLIYDRKARNVANILAAGGTEFSTEILQHATDKINEEFGRTAGTEDDAKFVQAAFDAIFSEEGLEAGLQGLIGGSGLAGIGTGYRAMNTIRTTVDGDLIDKNLDDLSKLRVKLNKATDKTEKAGIQKLVDTKISEIADSVRKGKDIYNSLSEGQLKEIENLTDLADVAASQVIELDKKLRAGEIDKAGYDLAYQGFKSEYDSVRQRLIDMNLEQNIKTAEDISKEKGLDIDVMTTAEVEALMNSDKVSEESKEQYFKEKKLGYELSAFVIGNKIIIDKDTARKTGSINVGMHEVLHPVFNKLIGGVKEQGKIVKQFRRAMTSSQRRFVDAQMKKRGYTSDKQYNTEYINVFSDALRKKQINYDKTTFEKIGDAIVSIFKPIGYTNIGFESGKDVYNFIKEFDQSAEQGKLTTKAAEALKGVDLSDAGLASDLRPSKTLSTDVEADLTSKILEVKKLAKENEEIAKKFGKDPIPGAKQIRLENEIRQGVKPIIEKIVTNRTKALYDPIAPDQKRNVSRREFEDSMRADIETMILNEFKEGGNTLEKFIVDRSYLRANDLAKRLGIEDKIKTSLSETDSEGKPTIQIADDYDSGATLEEIRSEEGRQKKLINPITILGEKLSKEYTEAIESEIQNITPEDIADLSFAKINDLAPEVTAKFWGTTVKKVTTPSANLATAEIPSMQNIILENADTFIKLLPNGAILEGDTASERLIGTGLGIPRKLQQAFYEQQERTSKGAGLIPFKLKDKITKKEFLETFGINEDGTFEKFGGKDPRAQTILALIRLYGQLTSNTAIRQLADLTDTQKADIKAGAAAIQFSKTSYVDKAVNRLGYADSLFTIQFSKAARDRYEDQLKKKRPDLKDPSKAIDQLFEWADNLNIKENKKAKYKNLALYYMANGYLILPEDGYKVIDAIRIGEVKKIDPYSFKNPNELLAKYDVPSKVEAINPDTVKTLSNKKELDNGITIYNVEESKEAQSDVRKIIDSNWGEKANPWCLAARTSNIQNEVLFDENTGEMIPAERNTETRGLGNQAWSLWKRYGPNKKIAFKNGKLLSFWADGKWWDRMDEPTKKLTYLESTNDGSGLNKIVSVDVKNNTAEVTGYKKGNAKGKFYAEYNANKELISEITRDGENYKFYTNYKLTKEFKNFINNIDVEENARELIFVEEQLEAFDEIEGAWELDDIYNSYKTGEIVIVDSSTTKQKYDPKKDIYSYIDILNFGDNTLTIDRRAEAFTIYNYNGKKYTFAGNLYYQAKEPILKKEFKDEAYNPEYDGVYRAVIPVTKDNNIIVTDPRITKYLTDYGKSINKATNNYELQFSKQATPVSNKYKLDKASRIKLFSLMIEGGFNSDKVNKFLEKNNVDKKDIETIKEELTHEGILEYMQDLKAANNGFKYEASLKNILNKLGKNFKVKYIEGKKGDLIITWPNKLTIKIEVKLNKNAQIGSASIGLFKTDNGKIVLTNLEDIKTSIVISEENKNRLIENIRANEDYINNLLNIINEINEKSSGKKITVSKTGHIKLPQNITIDGKTFKSSGEVWSLIKEKNGNKAGYFNYISDQSIVQDFYKGIDLIEIGDYGMYAIGEDSKMKGRYSMLKAQMNNVVRPAKSGSTLYFRLFPNFSQIENVKENSLGTKKGIEKISNEVLQSDNTLQPSKSLNEDFNNIIEDSTGIESFKRFSEAKGKVRGRNKGRFKFFIPPSADDFAGLLYNLTAKGAKGEAAQAWFKENLFDPFSRGINEFERYKQRTTTLMRDLKKKIKNVPEGLKKINETGFKNEDAVRIYLWAKKGVDIPGLSKTDQKELIKIINDNPKLKEFAEQIDALVNGYPDPQNDWLAGTITTDIINLINTSKREEFLTEWQANVDEIFSKENINKLRAAFGDNYVEALQDMLYRMKNGRNRPYGANKLTNQFMNWVNDSVGTIMFFNTRSALLQTLSMTNFINWGDNNPIMAAKAFANQKQFWSDFAMLFNSDFLKQRRSGLKNDVNADDIAAAAETSQNKAKAVLASILKMGFLPTQIADSFAIAMGGASFIRNRINTYISKGMDQASAEKQAFLDFQEVTEESQQSSRPDRISQQQASPLGRIILAFANTPMQYMRLTKKAFLDLKNGRGDVKTNISKIAYYFAVQNIIFSSLQAALFSVLFEDEDDEEIDKKQLSIANSMLDSILRGVGVYGAIAATLKNVVLEIQTQSEKDRPDFTVAAQRALSISPPVDSKMRKLMSAGRAFSYKTTREKMEGFGLDNPAYYAVGQVVSATTNIPADRIVRKADNIRVALDNDTKYWQKIALLLGYSQWDVDLVETSKDKKEKSKFGSTTKWKKKTWKK